MSNVREIISLMSSPSKSDISLVEKAYDFAKKAHEGQKRFSGEDFFSHVYETAKNIATYKTGVHAVAAGLLHDSIEDGGATEEEIRKEFGDEILFLVNGVTKLGKYKYKGVKRHVEGFRRFFLATSEDIRVLIIKLSDRLHNMKTLQYVPKEKQQRIAIETLEIYAPLAYRLGMNKLSRELEDLAFKFINPDDHQRTSKIINERKKTDIEYLEKIAKTIKKAMAKEGIRVINTHHRIKGVRSLYNKLKSKDVEESVHDILALRVVVSSVDECYKTLGVIHGLWKPVPARIKDFIALPKANGYRSLHTTVFTGDGGLVEIQIRTEEMHKEAEFGVAAHAKYKGKSKEDVPKLVKDIGNYHKNHENYKNFIENMKLEFFGKRIFVLTPNGDIVDLPEGSGPIDFAYAIHSDIGSHISGVKINGKMGSLDKELSSGDIIEVMTKKSLSPTEKWLKSVKTTVAKRHIRAVLDDRKK